VLERLPDGSQVKVPVGEIALLDGKRLRQSSLIPDSVMTMDWRDYPEHEDPPRRTPDILGRHL